MPPLVEDDQALMELFADSDERNFDRFAAGYNGPIRSLDQRLRLLLPRMRGIMQTGMQAGVAAGYVPAYALDRLEPAFTQTAIRAVPQSVLGEDLAAYDHETDILEVGPDAVAHSLIRTIGHELAGHKVSGGTFVTQDGAMLRLRRGFVSNNYIAPDASATHYGLDEAVQQHLLSSYLDGQFDILDPGMRVSKGDTAYYVERRLLAEFVLRANGLIDPRAIIRGSFEDSDESGAITTDRRTMVMQAGMAYGPGAYRKLSVLFDALDNRIEPFEQLVQRIREPELTASSSVRRLGSININGLVPLSDEFEEFDDEDDSDW